MSFYKLVCISQSYRQECGCILAPFWCHHVLTTPYIRLCVYNNSLSLPQVGRCCPCQACQFCRVWNNFCLWCLPHLVESGSAVVWCLSVSSIWESQVLKHTHPGAALDVASVCLSHSVQWLIHLLLYIYIYIDLPVTLSNYIQTGDMYVSKLIILFGIKLSFWVYGGMRCIEIFLIMIGFLLCILEDVYVPCLSWCIVI